MLIVDAGVLLAAADRNDPDHEACARLLENRDGELVTTPLVVAWLSPRRNT
ncbi:MAG: PIN domain-containing protein [Acidimicrobiales bacterium]